MTLTGSQISHLLEALLAAYPRLDDLRMMVRVELDENLDAIAGGGALRGVTFSLIEWANRSGRIDELIAGARRGNPGNPALRAFVASLGESGGEDRLLRPAEELSDLPPSVTAFILREKESLLKLLMAQYEAASRQLRLELNEASKPVLQERLRFLEGEMLAVQQEIDQLKR